MNDVNTVSSWGSFVADQSVAWSVMVHGGAGAMDRTRAEKQVVGCKDAAEAAASILRSGGSAMDAVQRAVEVLERNPLFNAGTGACLSRDGTVELDAAIMNGTTLNAGAVGALPPFEHPIAIARAVLDEGRHVLLVGEGAARFACNHGFVRTTSEAMTTDHARERLTQWQLREGVAPLGGGTVGAVAIDRHGHTAAATSTGGMVGKAPGRVGDTPLVGAGTYADDEGGAASSTGHGESILRVGLAKEAVEACRRGAYGGDGVEKAARHAIAHMSRRVAGTGGIILVDRFGHSAWARNTPAMAWAAVREETTAAVACEYSDSGC